MGAPPPADQRYRVNVTITFSAAFRRQLAGMSTAKQKETLDTFWQYVDDTLGNETALAPSVYAPEGERVGYSVTVANDTSETEFMFAYKNVRGVLEQWLKDTYPQRQITVNEHDVKYEVDAQEYTLKALLEGAALVARRRTSRKPAKPVRAMGKSRRTKKSEKKSKKK
jgi:hypothetical protein